MCHCYYCSTNELHPSDHAVFLVPDDTPYIVCAERTCDHEEDVKLG